MDKQIFKRNMKSEGGFSTSHIIIVGGYVIFNKSSIDMNIEVGISSNKMLVITISDKEDD